MTAAKPLDPSKSDPFEPARRAARELEEKLCSTEALTMTHGDLETVVRRDGMEMMRRFLAGHLELRSIKEPRFPVVEGADGVDRTHARATSRQLVTVFGDVEVKRLAFSARGESSLFPLDAALNLPVEENYSHGVREACARESVRGSFDAAAEAVCRTTGAKIAKRQVEELTKQASIDFDAFYVARAAAKDEAANDAPTTSTPLVLATDATGCKMRKDALRALERRAAETAAPDVELAAERRGPFESGPRKAHQKRMAQVATVYDVAPHFRKPVDISRAVRPIVVVEQEREPPPRPKNKRVWASLEQGELALIVEMFKEAKKRDPQQERPWVGLVDGDESQLDTMEQVAEKFGVTITIILDVIHVLQRIWNAGKCFCEERSEALAKWVETRFLAVLEGRAVDVAAGIRQSATKRKLSDEQRADADETCDYLIKYKAYLRYDEYLRAGFPIATGVIEGACRHLVKDRMDITGARWGLESAEAILRLRSLFSSGDFDEYWRFHLEEEHRRNHRVLYAETADTTSPDAPRVLEDEELKFLRKRLPPNLAKSVV
jgi:Uncharacterised protein family (UPF0236)